eukprot:scaffold234_cov353-Pavlova_lutheri.AAC.12
MAAIPLSTVAVPRVHDHGGSAPHPFGSEDCAGGNHLRPRNPTLPGTWWGPQYVLAAFAPRPGRISAIGSTGILVQLESFFSTPGGSSCTKMRFWCNSRPLSCTKMVFGPTPTVEPGGDCRPIGRLTRRF